MTSSIYDNLRVAIYARVSTEEQREGQTIDSQIAELERFAGERGCTVAGLYKDEGWSGSLLARPELDRLRDDASQGLFSAVLLNDVDRLARDVSHLGIIKRDLERRGVQLIFRKLPAEKSPTYNLMVNILGSFAEFERELIIDRTRRGRRHKVEVRQQYLGGNTAYGYRYVPKDKAAGEDGRLEIDPEEASVVRLMFGWVDREGCSARRVVRRLNELKARPQKGGKRWAKSSVLRILRCETYAGVWHYNKHESYEPAESERKGGYRRTLKTALRRRPRGEWLPLRLPAALQIVERGQWERVQQQLSRNLAFSPRNSKHAYLLAGLVRCGGCGATYVGDPNHGRYYYRCYQRCKQYPTVREERLNEVVWGALEESVLNPALIAGQVEQAEQRQAGSVDTLGNQAKEIEAALIQLQAEESRILEVYRTGIISPAQLGDEMGKIKTRRTALGQRRSELEGRLRIANLPALKRSLADYCRTVARRLGTFDAEERRRFLRLIVKEVVYEGEQVKIKGIIPVGDSLQEEDGSGEPVEGPLVGGGITTTMGYLSALNAVSEVNFEMITTVEMTKPS